LAIMHTWDTGLYCQRAVESVRQHFVSTTDKGDGKAQSWERMRTNLRLSEPWLKYLADRGKEQRHGDHKTFFSHEARMDLIARMRCVIDRYISFLLPGSDIPARSH
jgi:hypothetical protein